MNSQDKHGLLLTADLFLTSQIVAQARQAGVQLETAAAPRPAPSGGCWDVVVLDLELPGGDPAVLAADPALQGAALLAYGPHVKTDLFQAAERAGFTAVPKGQMGSAAGPLLHHVLQRSAGPDAN